MVDISYFESEEFLRYRAGYHRLAALARRPNRNERPVPLARKLLDQLRSFGQLPSVHWNTLRRAGEPS
jgi:hypothetical protein